MKKSDLKTGMVVEIREGMLYLVLLDTKFKGEEKNVIWREGGFWMLLDRYDENMKCLPEHDDILYKGDPDDPFTEEEIQSAKHFDVVAVYSPEYPAAILSRRLYGNNILWTEIDGDLKDMSVTWYEMVYRRQRR